MQSNLSNRDCCLRSVVHCIDLPPILVGVGHVTESVLEEFHNASSNVDIAAQAARLVLRFIFRRL